MRHVFFNVHGLTGNQLNMAKMIWCYKYIPGTSASFELTQKKQVKEGLMVQKMLK